MQGRYAQMLGNSATAAICAGPDNTILSWNSAAEDLFGHSAREAVGQPLSIIMPERHRAAHNAGLARAARTGESRLAGKSVEILALHADGTEFPVDLSLSMWFEDGQPMFGALIRDITDRTAARRRLEHLAHCDTLTSLPNRNALNARLATQVEHGPCTLVLLDLDGFKDVNDSMGHSAGDRLLAAVGARLSATSPDNFVARLGGDEFAILLPSCADPVMADAIVKDYFEDLRAPFEIAGQTVFVGTSAGIAMYPGDGHDAEALLARADLALYSAKSDGGGARRFFARAMQNRSEQRHRTGVELRRALANGALSGVEALLRWRHPEHGLLPPGAFLEVLQDSAIAEETGDWIIAEACRTAAAWEKAGLGAVRVSVNLFPAQLRSGRLLGVVAAALAESAIPPERLEIEITENTVLPQSQESTLALRKLNVLGVNIAFDDFGTGFASLSLLQKYPLNRLKIDRSFVAQIDHNTKDAAIVQAVIGMARSLGLTVIAEGVETPAQETALLDLGCDEAQGYRYGKPMPADDIVRAFSPAGLHRRSA